MRVTREPYYKLYIINYILVIRIVSMLKAV